VANKSGVYVVSKIHRAAMWRTMRNDGFPIISTWIDDGGPESINFSEAWPRYLAEASSAAVMLVFLSLGEVLKGGLLEIGAALSQGTKVIVVGEIPQLPTAILHDNLIEVVTLTEGIRLVNEVLSYQEQREPKTWQQIIGEWVVRCFGSASFKSVSERARRVLEEAIELAQASGVPLNDALYLTRYVYNRPVGEIPQELAGLSLTMLALAESHGLDLDEIQKAEIDRVLSLPVEHFKKRLAVKVAAGVAIGPSDPIS
jgi:hypothetical protein